MILDGKSKNRKLAKSVPKFYDVEMKKLPKRQKEENEKCYKIK